MRDFFLVFFAHSVCIPHLYLISLKLASSQRNFFMTTRRQLIRIFPTLPLISAAGATALLAACGDKKSVDVPTPVATPAPAPAPVAAAPAAPEVKPAPAASPAPAAPVATGPMVDEKDPAATGLGYVNNASKVDKTKYKQYVDGSFCSNCALYQGAAGSAQGGCPLFAGKQVSAKGWCSAWAKKAA